MLDLNDKVQFLQYEDTQFTNVVSALSEIQQWGINYCGITTNAWNHSKGEGIVIALIDTGVSPHPDLIGNMIIRPDVPYEWDFIGHGTHLAGIICAEENGSGVVGIAPKAKVLPIKVVDENGQGTYYHAYKAIEAAIAADVDIISMSFNSEVEPPEIFHDIIKQAYEAGIILIGSSGVPTADGLSGVRFPAAYDEVIACGGIDNHGSVATQWSAGGSDLEALAPAKNIYSTFLNDGYATKSGTSMAAPFIAGCCALIMSWSRNTPGVTSINDTQQMLQHLDNLCDPANQPGLLGKCGDIGFGLPNFANYMPWK